MTKEKAMEKIKLEYNLYEAGDISNLGVLITLIFSHYNYLGELYEELKTRKRNNFRDKIVSKICGERRNKDVYFDSNYYDKDNDLLSLGMSIVKSYRGYFYSLSSLLLNSNTDLTEVNKLVRFTSDSFNRNYKGVSIARSIIKTDRASLVGLSKTAPMDFGAFGDFFEEKVGEISQEKDLKVLKK